MLCAYSSVSYLNKYIAGIVALIGVGVTFRSIYILMKGLLSGESIKEMFNKVKTQLYAGALALCTSALIAYVRGYF